MIAADIDINAGSARDVAEHAVIQRGLFAQRSGAFQTIHENGVAQADLDNLFEIGENGLKLGGQIETFWKILSDAARDDAAAQQTIAGQLFVQAQQALTKA